LQPPEPSCNMLLTVLGPLAQLGERLVRNQEVGGSIPPRSTNLRIQLRAGGGPGGQFFEGTGARVSDYPRKVIQRCPNGHIEEDWEGPTEDGRFKKVALGRPCTQCGKQREVEYKNIDPEKSATKP
jgi:hypothetical protein